MHATNKHSNEYTYELPLLLFKFTDQRHKTGLAVGGIKMIISAARKLMKIDIAMLVAALLGTICVVPASANSITDPMVNWAYVAGHTAGLHLDSSNPDGFGGTTRAERSSSGAPESFYYRLDSMKTFTVAVYYYGSISPSDITVFNSMDGKNWGTINVQFSTAQAIGGNWYMVQMYPADKAYSAGEDLPMDTNYLGFTINGGTQPSSPQLTQVSIQFDGQMPSVQVASRFSHAPADIQRILAQSAPAQAAPTQVAPSQQANVPSYANFGAPALAYVGKAPQSAQIAAPPAPAAPKLDIGPVLNVPGGMTVLAAAGQAAINWYPVPGATHYTIRRTEDAGSDFETIATGLTSTQYVDHGLQDETGYYYVVTGYGPYGFARGSYGASASPQHGTVLLVDNLSDWSLASSHSDNLDFDTADGNIGCVKRLSDTEETFSYNVPGAQRFAINVYYTGDFHGQFSVDASPDNTTWSDVPLANTTPVETSKGFASVFAPANKLPENTNYIRFHLLGSTAGTDSPEVAMVRMTYGAATRTEQPAQSQPNPSQPPTPAAAATTPALTAQIPETGGQ